MKTSFKLIASALLLSLTVSALSPVLAVDDHTTKKAFAVAMFPAVDASKIWLCLEKYKPDEKVTLELVNEQGQVLFQEVVMGRGNKKKNACRQQFDMSQLSDGKYLFRIVAGSQKEEIAFKLATPTVAPALPTRLITMN
jgi:hypothetical protein